MERKDLVLEMFISEEVETNKALKSSLVSDLLSSQSMDQTYGARLATFPGPEINR